MKHYHLCVYSGGNTDRIVIDAEAHTFDNGMLILWLLNQDNEWAQIAMYPTSRTAITRIEGVSKTTVIAGATINQTADISEVLPVNVKETPTPKSKTNRGKK